MTPQHHPFPLRRLLVAASLAATAAVGFSATPVSAGVGAGSTTCFNTGAPTGAGVVLNGTAVLARGGGFLNFFRNSVDADPDGNSSVNYDATGNIANSVVTPVGSDGKICVYSSAATDVLADIAGYIDPSELLVFDIGLPTEGQAIRVYDTREDAAGKFSPNETFCFKPFQNSTEGQAIFLNGTAVAADGVGFLNFFPKGATSAPDANSAINFVAGRNIANATTVTAGIGGEICIYASTGTHVIIDVVGGVEGAEFTPAKADLSAERILDTRDLIDGPIRADESICVETDAFEGEAVVLNGTAIRSTGIGYMNIYADGANPSANSIINFRSDANIANGAIVPAGDGGRVCVFSSAQSHVAIDVIGYLSAGTFVPISADGSAERVLDTRAD